MGSLDVGLLLKPSVNVSNGSLPRMWSSFRLSTVKFYQRNISTVVVLGTPALCRSKPRCFRCGQDHPSDKCLKSEEFAHCNGNHFANNSSPNSAARRIPDGKRSYFLCESKPKISPSQRESYKELSSSNLNPMHFFLPATIRRICLLIVSGPYS
uniref:SFRICE_010250 n=1 Tax=Spodoptera frugiperda TaxID=7108 RepID=A0A2H1VPX4_SPOFR